MTDWLTLETHAETISGPRQRRRRRRRAHRRQRRPDRLVWRIQQWHGRDGQQAELGYSWRNTWLNFAVDSLRSFGDYRDVASSYGPPPAKRTDRALIGVTYAPVGSFGANYVELTYPGQPRSRFASAFYFRSFGSRFSLSLSVQPESRRPQRPQRVSGPFDELRHTNRRASRRSTTAAAITRRSTSAGRSRRTAATAGTCARRKAQGLDGGQAEFGYRGDRAQTLVGAQSLDGNTLGYGELSGALVWMDSHLFAARRIDDAFAVVATGVPDVPVMLENRVIGNTGFERRSPDHAAQFVQKNRVAIDPMRLPADARIERVDDEIVPADRSGVLVNFRVEPVQAASVVLHDATRRRRCRSAAASN